MNNIRNWQDLITKTIRLAPTFGVGKLHPTQISHKQSKTVEDIAMFWSNKADNGYQLLNTQQKKLVQKLSAVSFERNLIKKIYRNEQPNMQPFLPYQDIAS